MKKTKHTPEPWEAWLHGDDWTIEARSPASGFMADIANASFSEPDARRIVACVNALEGISTEILEMAGTGLMSEAAVAVGKLTKERDELLEALRALYGWTKAEVEHFGATCPDDFIIEMIEKALKNA